MTEDRYEIKGKIGQGGVGAVYKAYDTQLRREVAIKRVLADEADADNENATTNLLKEATALSSVQHPHICTVYDAGIDSDGPYVVMELINGKTLDKMVERGTLTYEDFREVAIQSQEAMIAAQELNLVHRDLKPSNVMVSWLPSGRFQVKLVDFGLAKFSAKPSLQTIDHGDAVFGSIFFMAPEQFERTPLDQRTDMYSLGALFYYSLTGSYPFDGDTAPQVMASHLQHTVRPLQEVRPDLPVWLSEWVMWHISRDMDHRPNSAKIALEKFLADETNAMQGGYGATQQLITPARRLNTGPQVIMPATGSQANQPAGHVTGPLAVTPAGAQQPPNPATAPQPILSPSGAPNNTTSPQTIKPAGLNTGTTPLVTPAAPATPASTPPTSPGIALSGQNPPATPQAPTSPSTAAPDAAATAAPALALPKKKGLSRTAVIIIIAVLTGAIILTTIIILRTNESNKENETYNRLMERVHDKVEEFESTKDQAKRDAISLPVTKEELEVIFKSIRESSADKDKKKDIHSELIALIFVDSAAGDFDADEEIAAFATDLENGLDDAKRAKIFGYISARKPIKMESHRTLVEYAVNHPDTAAGRKAVSQAGRVVDASFSDVLVEFHDNATSSTSRTVFKDAIINIAHNHPNSRNSISILLMKGYNDPSASENIKLSYIRTIGVTGSSDALRVLTDKLQNGNDKERINAAQSFAQWPTGKALNLLFEAYTTSEGSLNREISKSLYSILKNVKLTDDEKYQHWKKLIYAAPQERLKKEAISKISFKKTDWAEKLLNEILEDSSISDDVHDYTKDKVENWKNAESK